MPRPRPATVLPVLATLLVLTLTAGSARSDTVPLEDFAPYQPATTCAPAAKPGTVLLGRWIVRRYGGGFGSISRRCGGARSEHQEGRAFDWSVDALRAADRARVARLLTDLLAPDADGNPAALARRMGVMYVIWKDHIWSSWDGFQRRPYLSSSCTSLLRCSRTLRHRDHLHVSITRGAARGRTSWYLGRL